MTGGLLSLCALDPVAGVGLAGQLGRWPTWGSGDVVALGRAGQPDGGAWATSSLLPLGLAARPALGHPGSSSAQVRALAEHARRRLTRNGSVYGPVEDVEPVWGELAGMGVASREERWSQPLLVAPHPPGGLAAAVLRRRREAGWVAALLHAATSPQEPAVLEASVAMFRAELGYNPTDSGGAYARHVSWLVGAGRSYVVLDDGAGRASLPGGPRAVAFKADVGALWHPPHGRGGVALITGVWTRKDLRGQGVGSVALAAVVDAVRAEHVGHHGTVCLYVNDYNTPALGLYRGLGFERVGTYATVLL
ncbi:GNAT family N-acetyltransferase [Actinomyces sp. W5033]|uniref:GNAT family N-acetyltransferase n=1 Tax=Actinomyces sp. W5033 TaxID=3446479 RepID=UPI003EE32C4E